MPHTPHPHTPESDRPVESQGGHWILASVGKKVLRPGGRETTDWLLSRLNLAGADVVEIAPGLGTTARELLAAGPSTYTALDQDRDACEQVAQLLRSHPEWGGTEQKVLNVSAAETGLPDGCADVVIGEAMLTMQGAKAKKAIMAEAHRILRPGGIYAIHEMALVPDDVPEDIATAIRRRLAQVIKVNARPLTRPEWADAAREAGFTLSDSYTTTMSLLEPRRLLADEGPLGVATMMVNIARKPDVRRRVLAMRSTFTEYKEHLAGIGMILTKEA